MTYLDRFDAEFAPKLFARAKTFRLMFELLDKMPTQNLMIVETGCVREIGCWEGDGQSTILFDDYNNQRRGAVMTSVDISPEAVAVAKSLCNGKSGFIVGDSVKFLHYCSHKIDLLYLDSYDYNPGIEHESSLHALKELAAAQKNLRPGSIIAVDDNHPDGTGKGKYVRDYLANLGMTPIADEYQVVWVWK